MLHFEGTETFAGEPNLVFARLGDAGWVARALPDSELLGLSTNSAAWKVRSKFAFMAGNLDTTATVSYRTPDRAIRFRIASQGIGCSSLMEVTLIIRPREQSGSVVHWTGELVELGGLLGRVPKGMIQAAALKTIVDVWAAVRPGLDSSPVGLPLVKG